MSDLNATAVIVVLLLVAWEIAARWYIDAMFISPPSRVFGSIMIGPRGLLSSFQAFSSSIVLSGSIELILDDGEHPLVAGDHVVVTGVDHAWRAGPDGCRISIISLGVSPT